jgi:putative membrane protein
LEHSEQSDVTTNVIRIATENGSTFIVLPGVHPGPFHPIGSFDLPGVLSRAFAELGPVLSMHRPGGHERNLVTSADTLRYAEAIRDFGSSIRPSQEPGTIRGPIHGQIGKAKVSALGFADDILLTISFAPLGSDDMETSVEAELNSIAAKKGLHLDVVDAHNSIGHVQESPDLSEGGWERLISLIKSTGGSNFRAAYSHSKEFGFSGSGDLTDNGIGMLMIEAGGSKSVLILADANNAVPTLQAESSKALQLAGFSLIEFCTSDSHNLAARGLTVARGYKALGEATPVESIVSLLVKMAKAAETRLAPASFGSGVHRSVQRIFGSGALDELADLTQTSSKFAWNYLRAAVSVFAALLLLAVVL